MSLKFWKSLVVKNLGLISAVYSYNNNPVSAY